MDTEDEGRTFFGKRESILVEYPPFEKKCSPINSTFTLRNGTLLWISSARTEDKKADGLASMVARQTGDFELCPMRMHKKTRLELSKLANYPVFS